MGIVCSSSYIGGKGVAKNAEAPTNRVFAIYPILLCWKTCRYYCETDDLPNNRRPSQSKKKNRLKKWLLGQFFSPQQITFRWLGLIFLLGNRLQETQPNQNCPQTPLVDSGRRFGPDKPWSLFWSFNDNT